MRHLSIPRFTHKPVPALGVGSMLLADTRNHGRPIDRDVAIEVLHRAFDLGMTLVDTADIYAPSSAEVGYAEELVGDAARSWPGGRDALIVVTKIGITRTDGPDGELWGRDGSRDHLLAAAEASARRLGFVPDATLLHRIDREDHPIAESVRSMVAAREQGYAERIGIGNVHTAECPIAWEASEGTIAAIENERSPRYRGDGEIVAWAAEHDVAYLPWSPLGGGDDAARLGELYPQFAVVAAELTAAGGGDVSAQQVALAWLMRAGATVVPIPAFTRVATAEATIGALDVDLSDDQLARLDASPALGRSVFPD
jgi:aryl-alcohol dehydrogenase-like predicted oxidoreductase